MLLWSRHFRPLLLLLARPVPQLWAVDIPVTRGVSWLRHGWRGCSETVAAKHPYNSKTGCMRIVVAVAESRLPSEVLLTCARISREQTLQAPPHTSNEKPRHLRGSGLRRRSCMWLYASINSPTELLADVPGCLGVFNYRQIRLRTVTRLPSRHFVVITVRQFARA